MSTYQIQVTESNIRKLQDWLVITDPKSEVMRGIYEGTMRILEVLGIEEEVKEHRECVRDVDADVVEELRKEMFRNKYTSVEKMGKASAMYWGLVHLGVSKKYLEEHMGG